jgi:hypothetical protein
MEAGLRGRRALQAAGGGADDGGERMGVDGEGGRGMRAGHGR